MSLRSKLGAFWKNRSQKQRQWLWFVGLWFGGLFAVLSLSTIIKLMMSIL